MKNEYKKPCIEFIVFVYKDNITSSDNLQNGGVGGEVGETGGEIFEDILG